MVASAAASAAIRVWPSGAGSEIHQVAMTGPVAGVVADGAAVRVDRVWIHDTGSSSAGVAEGGELSVTDSLLEGGTGRGVAVLGSALSVERSVVRDVNVGAPPLAYGRGIEVVLDVGGVGSILMLRGSVIDRSLSAGVFVAGSSATVETSVISDTIASPLGDFNGSALVVLAESDGGARSQLEVRQSLLDRSTLNAMQVAGADVSLEHIVVRDTQPSAQGRGGRGGQILADPATGARSLLELSSSVFERNRGIGILVLGAEGQVRSLLVRDTESQQSDGITGRGFGAQIDPSGAVPQVTLSASRIERNREMGVYVGSGAVHVDNVWVRDTRTSAAGLFGDGVTAVSLLGAAAEVSVSASRIERSARAGAVAFGARLTLTSSVLSCNSIDLGVEPLAALPGEIIDGGGNRCGCGEERVCQAVSTGLAPPDPLAP